MCILIYVNCRQWASQSISFFRCEKIFKMYNLLTNLFLKGWLLTTVKKQADICQLPYFKMTSKWDSSIVYLAFLQQFVKTILSQGHLTPLPLYVCPVYWAYDHTLRVYPVPDVIIFADKYDPFNISNTDCLCINPVHLRLWIWEIYIADHSVYNTHEICCCLSCLGLFSKKWF